MSFDFSSISSEPLIYFLTHSTVFVAGMAVTFFCLGLAFGWLTWARYKAQCREIKAGTELLKDEIATLKRKLAEQIARASALTENQAPAAEGKPVRPAHAEPDPVLDSFLTTAASFLPAVAVPPPAAPGPESPALRVAPASVEPGVMPPEAAPPELPARPAPRPKPLSKKGILKSLAQGRMGDQLVDHAGADAALPRMTGPAAAPVPSTLQAPAVGAGAPGPSLEPDMPGGVPAESRLMSDPHLGLVYGSRPGLADELSHLKGVASTIERKLNDYGVYTFKQIALWSEENIREFSVLLAFKDRIHREQWVEQARELHYQKYGERL